MKKLIGNLILKISGWETYRPDKYKTEKSIIITAPHTSRLDYIFSIASFWSAGIYTNFVYKGNERSKFINYLFSIIGGINAKDESVVDFSINLLNESEKLILSIPVEGSRKRVDRWKTGFYYIAKGAKVPISLAYLDYEDKIAGIGDLYRVSEDIKFDLLKIQNFYKNFTPKNPENYNSSIY